MYLQFYGLRDIPFSLTPDPRFLYFTSSHREVMANLSYGIQYGKGLIVTTGEVGTGKTTMLRAMLTKLDRSVLCSYIFNPGLTVPDLYQQMGADFGLGHYTTKSDMLMKLGKMLMMRHSRGLRTVLIVDEAQGLSRELLEEIRLLLNFETYTEKQLQIIMVGQPELRQLLNNPDLRQLKQRISLRCEIKPLKADEVPAYIRARLKIAGASRLNLFNANAIAMIFRASEGIPRLINNICDNALLTGYATNAKTITPAVRRGNPGAAGAAEPEDRGRPGRGEGVAAAGAASDERTDGGESARAFAGPPERRSAAPAPPFERRRAPPQKPPPGCAHAPSGSNRDPATQSHLSDRWRPRG